MIPFPSHRWALAVAWAVLGLAACSPGGEATNGLGEPEGRERRFEFRYQALLPVMPEGAKTYRIWIPLPAETDEQQIHDLKIVSPVPYEQRTEEVFGNRYVYIDLDPGIYPWPLSVTLGFEVTRKENRVDLDVSPETVAHAAEDPRKFLRPNRLVPLDGLIGDLSRKHTAGARSDLEKARAIYDYVVSTMSYDKSGEGWGRGDALFACDVKKGNCTDFHALFIGMMRAAGIPARFEIGFPLPADKKRGEIGGYHCWAQFHLEGVGWVPVDTSEAWKDPSREDYFFGAHDQHRVHFTAGRDLRLDDDRQGEPLNYFIYPWAEADGETVEPLAKRFWFRDLAAAD